MSSFRFFLGTHKPNWLWQHSEQPLFVSRRQMPTTRFQPAITDWALDSGGFSELQQFGRWTITPQEYAALIDRFASHVGRLQWAAPMDWMCEPVVMSGGSVGRIKFAGTGLSIAEHQRRTVENFVELRTLTSVPIIPVVQGFSLDDYRRCIDLYTTHGVDLTAYETVGVGSICRRQGTAEAADILRALAADGLRIHGFGLKTQALEAVAKHIVSADSMAWSYAARRKQVPTCAAISRKTGLPLKNCANCYHAAREWYVRTMRVVVDPQKEFGHAVQS